MDLFFKRIGEEDIKSDYLILFGVIEVNDRNGIEGLLKYFIPLLLKILEGNE